MKDLTTWAAEGHYNIELQPVITVNMDYLKPAASASLVVAQKAPDKWVDFHHALLAYFRTQFQASNGTVVQNLDASWKQVKVIAAEVGVPSDVIDTFPVNAVEDYLKASTTAWQNAGYSGRNGSLGTPELVKDHSTVIPLGTQLSALRRDHRAGIRHHRFRHPGCHRSTPAPEATEPSQSGDGRSPELRDDQQLQLSLSALWGWDRAADPPHRHLVSRSRDGPSARFIRPSALRVQYARPRARPPPVAH